MELLTPMLLVVIVLELGMIYVRLPETDKK
jgi:hypothetical protein